MVNRNYNASNLTNEELIYRLMYNAEYYDTYWNSEKLELMKEDTSAILWEAAKRLDQIFWRESSEYLLKFHE